LFLLALISAHPDLAITCQNSADALATRNLIDKNLLSGVGQMFIALVLYFKAGGEVYLFGLVDHV
jgi:hypothetical protein